MSILRRIVPVFLLGLSAFSQYITAPTPVPKIRFFTDAGAPCNGCKLYSYEAGTTTPLATYQSAGTGTPNTNPVIMSSAGYANVWLADQSYKLELRTAQEVVIWTIDNIADIGLLLKRDLGDTTSDLKNSALVGFKAPNQAATTVRAELIRLGQLIDIRTFGAVCDGATNDTGAIQQALNAAQGGGIVSGYASQNQCAVTTLLVPSGVTLQNINLFAIASGVQFQSPVTIDGTSIAKSNIVLRNVIVNGNRANQTGMDSQPTEDGGRNCFRLIGNMNNVLLDGVQGNYCATDGLEIFSVTSPGTDADANLRFKNIVVRDSTFAFNRRHGISGDSMYDVTFINVNASNNGLDIGGTEGGKGARLPVGVGVLYGRGADFEGYGVGSGINHLAIINCVMVQNALYGVSLVDSADGNDMGFEPRRNIRIIGGSYDVGQHAIPGDLFAIKIAQAVPASYSITPELYQNVVLSGTWSNSILLISTKNVSLIATHVEKYSTYNIWLALDYAQETSYIGERITSGMDVFSTSTSKGLIRPVYNIDGTVPTFRVATTTAGVVQPYTNPLAPGLTIGANGGASRTYDIGLSDIVGTFPGAMTIGMGISASEGYLELRGGGRNTAMGGSANDGVRLIRGNTTDGFDVLLRAADTNDFLKPIRPGIVAHANLGTPTAGLFLYCSDCNVASPCTGAGSGAWAFRSAAGAWVCPF